MPQYDAIVVGSGPNGLAAAIELAQAGWSVALYEARDTVGGGMRSAELTLPNFKHDICSAVHPLGLSSPFFSTLPLADYGLEWIEPDLPLAHPFDDGHAAILSRDFQATIDSLNIDGVAWQRLMQPYVEQWEQLVPEILAPLHIPHQPFLLARFGLSALQSAQGLATRQFNSKQARALFAGIAAHINQPLDHLLTAAFGLVLGAAGHAVGWPVPRGGSQQIANALARYFEELDGTIMTNYLVQNVDDLPTSEVILFDLTPKQVLQIAGHHLSDEYIRALERYRYGNGVFKIDWALSEPVPWQAEACQRAGTIHLGSTLEEIATCEKAVWDGRISETPYVLLAQPSLFDETRAPDGKHTLWGYCHVPAYNEVDMTEHIENQIERFAPGFRDTVLARHTMTTGQIQQYNMNYIGGDINGGVQDWRQLFTRPTIQLNPYVTSNHRMFICSSATPPGGGVHGMCGYHAAKSVLRQFK